jgi:hypothetical protein
VRVDIKYHTIVASPVPQHVYRPTVLLVEEGIAFNHNVRLLHSLSLFVLCVSNSTVTRSPLLYDIDNTSSPLLSAVRA